MAAVLVVPHSSDRSGAFALVFVVGALSALLARRMIRRADERQSLVRQALEAESSTRERLAGVLHDESVQTLLVAGQELHDARRGEPGALDRAEAAVRLTIARLREEITDLHPLTGLGGLESRSGRAGTDDPRARSIG